jgi:hypothetical protein
MVSGLLFGEGVSIEIGVTQLRPDWVILTAIYRVFGPIARHMWGLLPANCVSPNVFTRLSGLFELFAQ